MYTRQEIAVGTCTTMIVVVGLLHVVARSLRIPYEVVRQYLISKYEKIGRGQCIRRVFSSKPQVVHARAIPPPPPNQNPVRLGSLIRKCPVASGQTCGRGAD